MFLKNYFSCQKEIEDFILKCKQNEDEKGYLNNLSLNFRLIKE